MATLLRKATNRALLTVAGLLALAAGPVSARAEFSPVTLSIEQTIVSRIQPALQSVDPMAIASVQITLRKFQKRLPGTSFTVKDLSLKADDGALELGSMDVILYLSDVRYGESLKKLALKLIGPTPVEPKIQIQALPADIVTAVKAAQAKRDGTDRKPAAAPTPTPAPVAVKKEESTPASNARDEALRKSIEDWRSDQEKWQKEQGAQWQQSQDQGAQRNQTWVLIAIGLGVLVLAGVGIQLISSRGLLKTLKGLQDAVTGVGSQLAESGGGAETAAHEAAAGANTPGGGPSNSTGENSPGKLSEDVLRAILQDAYWLAEDGYAAWLWSTIPAAVQASLLAKIPQWGAYARYMTSCKPVDLGAHQDPSYLSGLPSGHLSQSDLLALLGSQPGLYSLLPRIRQERLELSIMQRLGLEASEPLSLDAAKRILTATAPSAPREIVGGAPLPIRSIEEETELLDSGNLPIEVLRRIPSLLVYMVLDENQVKEILEGFSARDLAGAWVGPEPVLSKLMAGLPAAKSELLQSYLEKAKPSRTSPAFERLRAAGLAKTNEAPVDGASGEEASADQAAA